MGRKRLFISDVHVGAGRFGVKKTDYPYEWDWLSLKETVNFVSFLNFVRTKYPEEIHEIVFIGDIFDDWVFPHDQAPPTMEELIAQPKNKGMGVRPTQLTIKQPAFQKFRPDYDLFKIYKICMNVEMCEMCRPDTHALPKRSPRNDRC